MTLSHTVELGDKDIIKMIEEYLANRQFDIALMCLERESGIINGVFSEDGLFLRQLILDGHWDDVLEFLLPLHGVEGFDKKRCLYLIYKHKFLELLCIKLDPGPLQNHDFTLDEVVSCLTELEHLCSDRKEYDNLCFLLTLPSISSDQAYKNWNPSSARINCFNELYPLVSKFIGLEKAAPSNSSAKHDRLVNLLAKGLLYEMCVELCTARACGTGDSVTVNHLLNGTPCSDADLSLVTWLQKVPSGTLAIPFEKKSLKLKTERLEKPTLEAVWSEQLLAAPIKPKQFPHTSIPARTKSSQIISQSMMAMYDGLSSNLFTPHGLRGSMSEPRRHPLVTSTHLSRSYAHTPANKFVLTNSFSCDRRNNPMNQSVEQLFSKSALSSPRPPTLSSLATNKTSEILSPGFADLSPTFAPPGSTPQLHDAASPQLHDNTKPASNRQTLPSNRQSPNVKPEGISGAHKSVQQDDAQRRMATPDTVRPSASAPPVSACQTLATSARYSSSDRICSIQKPDILQHDIKETVASVPGRGDMAGSIRASQDLYAQYQQQKKRIEEEMRLMEERDEKWRAIHSDTQRKIEDPVPQLDLDQSENDEAPAETCQQDVADDTFDELHSAVDPVGIKQFVAVETLEEQGPVRAIAFHPSGECYAVGSNTKVLRVCQYPDMSKVTTSYHLATKKPKVLAKKVKHHAGSIYCTAWNTLGTVIATGSNDHSVKCVQWLTDQNVFGSEKSISVHDGTVRDVSFLSTDQLLSAGAGDCTVCLTDIASGSVVRRYKGHDGHVLSLYTHRESQKFISGGQDKKALMWDTRMSVPVQTYQSSSKEANSAFASVCLDPAPRVLASGHDNSYCTLYDLRQGRLLQAWRPHTDEVRSARFNADATYFLSGSYDTTVKLMDMQGDITQPLKTVQVAEHMDKVIQCRWHPLLPSFITSSADKTVTCWAIQIDD